MFEPAQCVCQEQKHANNRAGHFADADFFADRIAIMYAGEIVERASGRGLATDPRHPYTQGLLRSFPPLTGQRRQLSGIPGAPPDLRDPPSGCRFHPRCPNCLPEQAERYARPTTERPVLREIAPAHFVACHLVEEETR